ncbi:MAG: ATP-binding cassette domain-containing protein [Lachnospiraceae bacterium]|nr:ATP-binding cassette domain-containing protein [Lachnospiraceae bacterium]
MAIELRDVSKRFGNETVLSHVTVRLEDGECCCLAAPSGSGKTTFLRLLMRLEKPDEGSLLGLEGKRVSAVFQEDRLLEESSVLSNLRLVTGKLYTAQELAFAALRLLPEAALLKKVRECSGGMKRRVALLRALLAPSELLLLDEPFAGLDEENKRRAVCMIQEYSKGRTVIVAVHSKEEAAHFNARILQL